ncbi:Dihydroxy-acid dehydratase [Bienertia sinuspersici]
MGEIKKALLIHNLNTLHLENLVMGIQHWRLRIEHMLSTTGTGMMMGRKYLLTPWFY